VPAGFAVRNHHIAAIGSLESGVARDGKVTLAATASHRTWTRPHYIQPLDKRCSTSVPDVLDAGFRLRGNKQQGERAFDGMNFRVAKKIDASSLAAISIEVWLGTYLRKGVSAFFADYALSEFTASRFEAILEKKDEHIIVSENEAGIDGFIRITSGKIAPVQGSSTTEITTLYVQPRHHGKGIGQGLLHEGARKCATDGVPSLWLSVNSENTSAIDFYLARGFQNVGQSYFRIREEAYLNEILSRGV
jgi:ribosomal protein S18 acetylase RimI-like enzyme